MAGGCVGAHSTTSTVGRLKLPCSCTCASGLRWNGTTTAGGDPGSADTENWYSRGPSLSVAQFTARRVNTVESASPSIGDTASPPASLPLAARGTGSTGTVKSACVDPCAVVALRRKV